MIKVGYIVAGRISLDSPVGYSVHIRNFIRNFGKIGGEIFFIRKSSGREQEEGRVYDLKWPEGLPKLKKMMDLLFNLKLYWSVKNIARKEKPDILHERETYLSLSGFLAARKLKIPYILEVNAPMMYEVRDSLKLYQKIQAGFEKSLFAGADRIIVVSKALKSYLVRSHVSASKIRVVPNGVDEEVFHPDVSGKNIRSKLGLKKETIVCYAGSLHQAWQGLDELLRAAHHLREKDSSILFLIIGGTEKEVKRLKDDAPDNMIFTGRVRHEEVPSYLAAADILAAPYKQEEGLGDIGFYNSPVKLYEYMGMGKPIIASRIGQVAEVLVHGENGMLTGPANWQELADAVLSLAGNQELKKKLGRNARAAVEKSHTWEENSRAVMRVYREVLEK